MKKGSMHAGEKGLRRWFDLLFATAAFLDLPSGKVPKLWERRRVGACPISHHPIEL